MSSFLDRTYFLHHYSVFLSLDVIAIVVRIWASKSYRHSPCILRSVSAVD